VLQTLAAIPLFGHAKTLHMLIETGSVPLAVAVPYPVKVTRISYRDKEVPKKPKN